MKRVNSNNNFLHTSLYIHYIKYYNNNKHIYIYNLINVIDKFNKTKTKLIKIKNKNNTKLKKRITKFTKIILIHYN